MIVVDFSGMQEKSTTISKKAAPLAERCGTAVTSAGRYPPSG
jgi:hypothetical protein